MKKKLDLAVTFAGLVALVGFVSFYGSNELHTAGFQQMEWQLRFVDKDGHPIRGVQLSVLDNHGKKAFGYPITDYLVNVIPTSNDDGLMVFHHVSLLNEFSMQTRYLFFFIPVQTQKAPVFRLSFAISGKSVAAYNYADYFGMNPDEGSLPVIRRAWVPPGPSPPGLAEHLRLEKHKLPSMLGFILIAKEIVID